MESNHNIEVKVGIFVAFGLLLAVISIVLLGGDRILFTPYYEINVKFKDVQGLAAGSVVSLSGVVIGNIDRIEFSDESDELIVVMKIDQTFQSRLTKGSTAEVKTKGALGDKIIYLMPGPKGAPALQEGEFIQAAEGADLMTVLTSRGTGFDKVFDIIDNLQIFTQKLNSHGRVDNILDHLSESSVKLRETLSATNALVSDVRNVIPSRETISMSVVRLENILRKIDEGKGTLGAVINDPFIHNKLKSMLGDSPGSKYMKNIIRTTIKKSDNPHQKEGK